MKIKLSGIICGGEIKGDNQHEQWQFFIDAKVCGELNTGIEPKTIEGIPVSDAKEFRNIGSRVEITIEVFP